MKDFVRRAAGFLAELKRRKVYQVAVVYLIVAIGALELADALVPATNLPEWSEEFFVVLAIVGFPIVVALAWAFDVTPGGLRRERTPEADSAADPASDAPPSAPPGRAPLDPNAVAVLPFANLSEADDAEPFAAGLHDDLLTELSRASALTVISRTSVLRYRGTTRTMREIGRDLGAGTIVEGAVQKAGNRVRLNVQLIDARSDAHLWAERYDRELSPENIFDLQSELAGRIMEALHAKLTGDEAALEGARPTSDLEAYRQYSIARALFVERSGEALRGAAEHFERALERDPGYAPAWAGLSHALIMLVDYRHSDSAEPLERAKAAARRALEIDPDSAEAHSALGNLYSARREGRKALEEHERAIALSPNYAGAHQWRCWVSLLIGHPETALEAGERACRLDPLDPEAKGNFALAHVGVGQDEQALRVAREALERHPGFDWSRWVAGLALSHLGRKADASETLRGLTETWTAAWPRTVEALDRLDGGDEDGTRRLLERQLESGAAFHAGLLHAALGESDAAFEAIRSGLPLAWDEALYLRYFREDPLAALRRDARWSDLIEELDGAWGA